MEFNFVNELGLSHFDPSELLKHTDCTGNTEPPRYMWGNIVPTILILDRLRTEINSPIYLTSVYRAPRYNRMEGGSPLSLHQAFSAIDFKPEEFPLQRAYDVLRDWRGRWFKSPVPIESERVRVCVPNGCIDHAPLDVRTTDDGQHEFRFAGGLALYNNTHVHIDTRGIDADW